VGQKAVDRRYAVKKTIEECPSLVKTALNELNLYTFLATTPYYILTPAQACYVIILSFHDVAAV